LGVGLGVGIPVALCAVGLIWFLVRRRSKEVEGNDLPPPDETYAKYGDPLAVQLPAGETEGPGIRAEIGDAKTQELDGKVVHELPGEMEKH
jgi:hypothetical protein